MDNWLIISNFTLAGTTFLTAIVSLLIAFKVDKPKANVFIDSFDGNSVLYVKFRNKGKTNIYIDSIFNYLDGIKYFIYPINNNVQLPVKIEPGQSFKFEFFVSELEKNCVKGGITIYFLEGTGKRFKLKYRSTVDRVSSQL